MMALSSLLAAAAWLVALSSIRPVLADTYPITIHVYSPMISLTPTLVDDWIGGWNYSTTEEHWNATGDHEYEAHRVHTPALGLAYVHAKGVEGTGDSVSRASYTFNGTGLRVMGFGGVTDQTPTEPCVVGIIVDGGSETSYTLDQQGTVVSQTPQLLANLSLPNGKHQVDLYPRRGDCGLHSYVVDMDVPSVSAALLDKMATSPNLVGTMLSDGKNQTLNPALKTPWKDVWKFASTYESDPRIYSGFYGATLSLNIGKGNVFLRVNGSISPGDNRARWSMDPTPPGLPRDITTWGRSSWNLYNQAKYMAVLDPTQEYTIKVTVLDKPKDVGSQTSTLTLTWFETWRDDSLESLVHTLAETTSSSSQSQTAKTGAVPDHAQNQKSGLSSGAIAGIVIAAVVVLTLLALVLYFGYLLKRRQKHDNDHQEKNTPSLHAPSLNESAYQVTPLSQGAPQAPMDRKNQMVDSWGITQGLPPGAAGPTSQTSGTFTVSTTGPQPSEIIQQEHDAGALRPLREEPVRRVIPPSYDPSWTSETSSTHHTSRV